MYHQWCKIMWKVIIRDKTTPLDDEHLFTSCVVHRHAATRSRVRRGSWQLVTYDMFQ